MNVLSHHRNGETTFPVSSRIQFTINSSTPPKQEALQLVYPCSRHTYVLPGSETPTLIESLENEYFCLKRTEGFCCQNVSQCR